MLGNLPLLLSATMRGESAAFNPYRRVLFILFLTFCMIFLNGLLGSKLRFTTTTQQALSTKQARGYTIHNNISINDGMKDIDVDDDDTVPERILYSIEKDRFVDKFVSCAVKKTCHILYWHIQKTGGTYVATRLYYGMNKVGYNSREWCCHDSFMTKRFRPNPEEYCSRKMGVYEVRSHHFTEVIETCHNTSTTDNHTFLGVISVREPLEQTMSAIHQQCNVHSGALEEPFRSICERCSYSGNDTAFFDRITNHTNEIFLGVQTVIEDRTLEIPILILDNVDISDFFQRVESRATDVLRMSGFFSADEAFHFPSGRSNAQDKVPDRLCDFAMPVTMMKHHATSLGLYRWIIQARYGR